MRDTLPRLPEFTRSASKSLALVRMIWALALGKAYLVGAYGIAESKWPADANLLGTMKAAMGAGSMSNALWAGPPAVARVLQDEFLEAARPTSILLWLTQARRVPLNVRVPRTSIRAT